MLNEIKGNSEENPFGFVVLNKPSGITSHDCIQRIRKIFNIRRVGHTGTLDPAVTGVLPIALGNATRLIPYLTGSKTYIGSIQLGKNTSTDDLEGEVLSIKNWPEINSSDINKYLNKFRGKIQQVPPHVSSININGERAYKRHRKGEIFQIKSREIEINELTLLSWEQSTGQLKIQIDCSAGTYIRSIARDLGKTIGCGGCLANLNRIQTLGFTIDQAINLPNISEEENSSDFKILDPFKAIKHLPYIDLSLQEEINNWQTGRQINLSRDRIKLQSKEPSFDKSIKEKHYVAIRSNSKLIGIGEWNAFSILKPKVVFNAIG